MNDGSVHLPDQIFHKSGGTQTISTGELAGGVGNLGIEGVGDALFHLFILYLFIHTRQVVEARGEDFLGGKAGHAAVIEGAGFEEAGATGDFMANEGDGGAEGAGPSGLGRAEDGDGGFSEEGGEVHGSAVVAEDELSVGEPVGEFESGGFSGEIGDGGVEGLGHGLAGGLIVGAAEEDRLERVGFLEGADDGSEGGGTPAFGGSVGGAGEDGEVGLGGGVFGFGEGGGRGEFGVRIWEAEIFQQAEILASQMDEAGGGCAARAMFGQEKIAGWAGETGSVGNGEDFESSADGVWKKSDGGDVTIFQRGVEGEWEGWSGKVFKSWQKQGGEWGEGGGAEEEERGTLLEPALVEVDGGQSENEIAEPIGQTKEVRIAR